MTKEIDVVDVIKFAFPVKTWICNKIIEGGSSRRRPDMLCELNTHFLIIEVDEHMHTGYGCEDTRMLQICEDVKGKPVVFIRFNPDNYKDENGRNVTSCWANSHGIMKVKECKKKEWQSRLALLQERIQYWIDNSPGKDLEIEYLFYGKDTTLAV